ncbi:MAG: hypothetical protein IAE99_06300 [Rhodothermales bacterium]|nr:hypothetical protein [Rhodothermales bacterium]
MKRSLGLVLLLAALGGCDLLGDDYDDLAPGTFRLRADGKVYTGTARFYPTSGFAYNPPVAFLMSRDSTSFLIRSHDLLNATVGSRIEGVARFYPGAASFINIGGSVTITGTPDGGLTGTFRYQMKDIATATFNNRVITVEGGFNAVRVAD